MLSLTDLKSITWNWSCPSCDFFRNKITYLAHWVLKDGVHPATQTWRQLQNAPHCRPTLRYELLLVWWATTGGSSKGSCTLHSPLVSTVPERGLARCQSRCFPPRMPWRPSRCWSRHAWQHPSWCLLTTPNHSCWRMMYSKMDWGQCCHRSRHEVSPCCLWQQGPDTTQEKLLLHQTGVFSIEMGSYSAL